MTIHIGGSNGNDSAITKYRAALRGRIGEAKFLSWFADLALEDMSDNCVTLSTGSRIKKEMIDSRWLPLMKETWRHEIGPVNRMRLTHKKMSAQAAKIDAQGRARASKQNGHLRANGFLNAPGVFNEKSGEAKKPFNFREIATPLDERKDFDAFAVDDSNRMAWAAARQACVDNGSRELIYVYGRSGAGKTHLLQAVGLRWARDAGRGSVAYITYASLISACVNAVWSNSIHALHQALLNHDIIMIDDIHLLDKKARTQEELLNAIDAFLARGKQVVIAGEAPPSKLPEAGINQRLADRLAGGICAPIASADDALRLEVLKKRLKQKTVKCTLSPDSLEFIARHFHQSMRETIGAMNQLLLMYQNDDVVVGLNEAKAVLKMRLEDRKRVVTMADVIVAGAAAFGISVDEMTCRAQPQRLVRARHAVVYCAREDLRESFPRIGKALHRDHTTAMSSYRRAQALLERDKPFQDGVRRIREALGG